jgi:DNA-binding GntR family transcriptional regulator
MNPDSAPRPEIARRAQSLRARILAELRHAIEIGLLQPGERLIERDLCEQLSVSRTTLREVLRELHTDGLLETSAGRGLAVATCSVDEMRNAYQLRAVLEALVIEQFIGRANADEHSALEAQGDRLKAAYVAGDVGGILSAKRDFYDLISRGARNSIAFDLLGGLVLRTSGLRCRSLSRVERQRQSVCEIDAILLAIGARDVPTARRAAESHVANAARSALAEAAMATAH